MVEPLASISFPFLRRIEPARPTSNAKFLFKEERALDADVAEALGMAPIVRPGASQRRAGSDHEDH